MKHILVFAVAFFAFSLGSAQEKQTKNKNQKVEFPVGGNCEMCKKRIEKAAYSVKGVKSAVWDINSGKLQLLIDERKCSSEAVQKAIAQVGHDAGKERATEETYKNLHHCCLYDRLPE